MGRFISRHALLCVQKCVLRLMFVFQIRVACACVCARAYVNLSPQTSKNKAKSVRSHLAMMEPHSTLPFTSNQPHTGRSGREPRGGGTQHTNIHMHARTHLRQPNLILPCGHTDSRHASSPSPLTTPLDLRGHTHTRGEEKRTDTSTQVHTPGNTRLMLMHTRQTSPVSPI